MAHPIFYAFLSCCENSSNGDLNPPLIHRANLICMKIQLMPLPGHRLLIASTALGMFILLASNWVIDWPLYTDLGTWLNISLAVLFPAFLLLFWALITLGWQMFQIHPGEHLINRGPYRHIRHPFTLGMMVGLAGLALSTNNWLAILATVLILWPVLILRAKREEIEMRHAFGTEWDLYTTSTQFLIPWVW